MTDTKIFHLINRLSFGPTPGQIEKIKKIGIETYIQSQLQPDSIPYPKVLIQKLEYLDTLPLNPGEITTELQQLQQQGKEFQLNRVALNRIKVRFEQKIFLQATKGRFLRTLESPRHLEEVIVDFWYNHFNVFGRQGLNRLYFSSYEQQAIRPHALGKFRELLGATAHHPAMLIYLDNWQSYRGKINENYARELLELHTLGVDGGYSQNDVIALAKIFTGWGLPPNNKRAEDRDGFYFDEKRHEPGDKFFLGQTIKENGIAEGETALDILASHPATAKHISYKLAQTFVLDQPPESLVNVLAKSFLESGGNISQVLNTLFNSSEFWQLEVNNSKFKNPYRFVASAMRAIGNEVDNFRPINGILDQLGMPLYGCVTPDGYKNTKDAWLDSDTMIRRSSLAVPLSGGLLGRGKPISAEKLMATLGNNFSAQTRAVIDKSSADLRAALIFGSPEFMRY
ncbi:MAG: DUF1800 domain-containing protein [Okeania sp. SIO3I5]|uniref:DUF1800 domain-containing protein n=1 Tax=Okeania sp. SIO3I5 TaxID=2607805 RepID=UPI0013BAB449|nr:DUF1800 domain-containing protein [Okeania sp. SIO3I5]NEQ40536.1 DUF1800 domain-containing protein [Okeania sp. SIO3I5]